MVDRFLLWFGAVTVTAGVAAGMAAGAGVASADSPSGADTKGTTSSESAKPTESKPDSDSDGTGTPKPKPSGKKPKKDATAEPKAADETDAAQQGDEDKTADETVPPAQQPDEKPAAATDKDATPTGSDTAETVADAAKPAAIDRKPAAKRVAEQEVEEPASHDSTESTETAESTVEPVVAAVVPTSRNAKTAAATLKTAASPETAAVALAAPANAEVTSTAAASPLSGLLSAIGTIVFNLYGLAISVVGGPPVLPPNSTVTVRSSTLRIDCANGYEVPADWYIPASAEQTPPQRLIYLQHGFLAAGPWYSYTAATLAEQTNSIVVAPSITSNFLSCDACWLGAPRMQQAVANLFEDDNTRPRRQRAGGGLYRTDSGPGRVGRTLPRWRPGRGHGRLHGRQRHRRQACRGRHARRCRLGRLDGFVAREGSRRHSDLPARLAEVLLESVRRRQRCAARGAARSVRRRHAGRWLPCRFDAGRQPLIQFSQQLVAGFSKPQNVAAAQILMVGWVNDMFAGNQKSGHLYETPARRSRSTPLRGRPPR